LVLLFGKRRREKALFDDMGGNSSPAHALNPGAKLVCALGFIVAVVSFPGHDINSLLFMAFYPVLMLALSGIPLGPVLSRSFGALPFALAIGMGNIFYDRSAAFIIGSATITGGMISCVSLLVKTLLSVSAVMILGATTSFASLCATLVKAGMPKLLALQFSMTHRYIAVLVGEASAMSAAYRLRSRRSSKGVQLRDAGSFLGQLLLRSFDRAGRVYEAMRLRGFDGLYRSGGSGMETQKWRLRDTAFILIMALLTAAARFFHPAWFFTKGAGIFR
jgi:cobalt/nickel transport system permease protein